MKGVGVRGWTWSMAWATLLSLAVGCGPRASLAPPGPDIKAPGNLPVRTAEQLAAEARDRAACAEACTGGGAAQADCVQRCLVQHPIEQVEVVPSAPPAPSPEEGR